MVLAVVIVAIGGYVALTLPENSSGVVVFRTTDQVAVAGLGLVIGAGVLLFGRSRVDADAVGIRIRNLAITHRLPWSAVRAVVFDPKSSWASLALRNGDEVSLLAVLAADKERAVAAVEGLRVLLAAAKAQEPVRPPLLYDN